MLASSSKVNMTLLAKSLYWIHVLVSSDHNPSFLLIGIYGPLQVHKRKILWNFIQQVALNNEVMQKSPWLLMRDFNRIFEAMDKPSHNADLRGIEMFQEVISNSALFYLKPNGLCYTWTNGREGTQNVWERLDRVFCNHIWPTLFPHSKHYLFMPLIMLP